MTKYLKLLENEEFMKKIQKYVKSSKIDISNDFLLNSYDFIKLPQSIIFAKKRKIIMKAIKKFGNYDIMDESGNLIAKLKKSIHGNFFLEQNFGDEQVILFGKYKKNPRYPRKYWIVLSKFKIFHKYKIKVLNNFVKKSHFPRIKNDVLYLKNKIPKYKKKKGYVLNMINAKCSSSKNYQLIFNNKIVFEFGKMNNFDLYKVYFQYPFSLVQAFSLGLITL